MKLNELLLNSQINDPSELILKMSISIVWDQNFAGRIGKVETEIYRQFAGRLKHTYGPTKPNSL